MSKCQVLSIKLYNGLLGGGWQPSIQYGRFLIHTIVVIATAASYS